jgi:hypothetical protein
MNAPLPSVPLSQFAQAATAGWELHQIGGKFYACRRAQGDRVTNEHIGDCRPMRLLPFPGCEAELPVVARRLFIEVQTDIKAGRCSIVAQRCARCGGDDRCSCLIDLAAGFASAPMIGGGA